MKKNLKTLCNFINKSFKLIYRASRDGFSANSFHLKCDNRSKTLTVIKSNNNNIFGGYSDLAWDISEKCRYDYERIYIQFGKSYGKSQ